VVADDDDHATVAQLLASAVAALLREQPQTELTLRRIALRAAMSHRSLSEQFGSVDSLLADIALTRLLRLPLDVAAGTSARVQVADELLSVLTLMADEPRMGIACANAMLSADPAVVRIRSEIENELSRRLGAVLGYGAWPEVVDTVRWTLLGAIATAAGGGASLTQLRERLGGFVELLIAQ
jgi:AcrR family transcriptional regulator